MCGIIGQLIRECFSLRSTGSYGEIIKGLDRVVHLPLLKGGPKFRGLEEGEKLG